MSGFRVKASLYQLAHWTRRLVETLAALILSKFVIVATLSLAAGAVSSGTAGTGSDGAGFSAVLAGGALLVMATFVPFAILRMIPAVEAGAVAHLDGLRERGAAAMTRLPRSAASHALHEGLGALGDSRLMAQSAPVGGAAAGGAARAAGDPESPRQFEDAVARGVVPAPKGPKPVAGWKPETDGGERDAGPDGGTNGGTGGAETVGGGPEVRRRHPGFRPAPTGPATPQDAWKWEGVPPGRSLIGKVEAGKMRYYMGDDGHGPCIKWLPPAWPEGERSNDG